MSTPYVAFLRAINLVKRRRVPMAELRELVEGLGYSRVATHLQSGDVVFDGDGSQDQVTTRLEAALLDRFGFEVPVIVRTRDEMDTIAAAHAFGDAEGDPTRLHVVFLDAEPDPASIEAFDQAPFAPDRLVVRGREVHVHYPEGAGRSKLSLERMERALGVTGTARNWSTVQRLAAMAREMG